MDMDKVDQDISEQTSTEPQFNRNLGWTANFPPQLLIRVYYGTVPFGWSHLGQLSTTYSLPFKLPKHKGFLAPRGSPGRSLRRN